MCLLFLQWNLNRWKILKYISSRHNLIFCRSYQSNHISFMLSQSCWFIFLFRIFFLFLSSHFLFSIDSAFTERILGLPNENYKGYVEADATQRARHIPSHSYFLIHGLADSSAPYLHGIQLARALAKAGVIFQYQVSKIEMILYNICECKFLKQTHWIL